MFKKIISMVVAAITTAAICVTAMASSSEHGSVDIDQQEKYWRSFKATTTNSEPVDIIYAGIQCLRLDNGAPASENILEPDYNTDEVYATVSVDYSSYPDQQHLKKVDIVISQNYNTFFTYKGFENAFLDNYCQQLM